MNFRQVGTEEIAAQHTCTQCMRVHAPGMSSSPSRQRAHRKQSVRGQEHVQTDKKMHELRAGAHLRPRAATELSVPAVGGAEGTTW